MSEKFRNKYRIASTRAQWWDYGRNAAYFITICTAGRECFFGKIENKELKMSHVGVIADLLWFELKNHRKNVFLGEYVVMPNHFHGILILNNENRTSVVTDTINNDVDDVETGHALSLQPPSQTNGKTIGRKRFQNIGKNTVSSIIGGYKSAVSKHARRLGYDFGWQDRFHDHIIRNEKEYLRIEKYIIDNPSNWNDDRFFKS
ncbi:transposase [Sinomicrobium kalidii]|uniref:transposase n=1 Tax=Sinomicrobium kalidii TaxID=2900738 RepID=UPI001E3379FC|nr:transposase [Sinomicrobium kalidii]UGU16167.1 transposase [Sinomicrobium kalidii]